MIKKGTNKLRPFTDNRHYEDFKAPLYTALEKILHVHLSAVDQIISKMKDKILFASSNSTVINQFRVNGMGTINVELMFASVQVSELAKRLRKETYLLAHAGETEAMSRALNKSLKTYAKVKDRPHHPTITGGSLDDRIMLYFQRLGQKIQDALRLSFVLNENQQERLDRIKKCFPPTRKISSTPALRRRKLKESDLDDEEGTIAKLSTGISDDEMWDEIIEDYRSTTLPDSIFKRGPDDKTFYYDVTTEETTERYTWEVEQEITEDFVREVRAGTQDAATENGVTDFMWIAIIDGRTDECCSVRDGLSSSEIENQMSDGTIDEDECDAIVAPAHFNCRCDSAPMTDDLPEAEPIDYGGFDDWLDEKAAA